MLGLFAMAVLVGGGVGRFVPSEAVVEYALEGQPEALMRQAQQLRYESRWFEAAALYRRILAEYPTASSIPQARFYLASTLERDQRWDEASEAYSDFLRCHPDQRMLGKEARLGRVHCWGIRQGASPQASSGLLGALEDPDAEVRVNAALELAKTGDKRGVPILQVGLGMPGLADRCTMALMGLGVKPESSPAQVGRFLVIRIREKGKPDTVTVRVSTALARAVASYLSDEQVREVRRKGVDLENLSGQVLNAPKGTLLFSVEDGKSTITVTVE